jgi:ferredoxin
MTADPKQESVEDVLALRAHNLAMQLMNDCGTCVDNEGPSARLIAWSVEARNIAAALERRNVAILEVAEKMEREKKWRGPEQAINEERCVTCGEPLPQVRIVELSWRKEMGIKAARLRAIAEGE